jgi:hypothetical protein
MSTKRKYELDFSVPQGWIQLPVLDDRKAFRHDKKVETWSMEKARAMLGPDASPAGVTHRASELAKLTYGSRARGAMYGLALYPTSSAGLIAILDVQRLVPDRTYPELTFDVLRELYAKHSADTVGDIDEMLADVPAGPALRIHRERVEAADPTGQGTLIEGVTLAIRPPGTNDAIVMVMTWAALQLGDRLAAMADAIAETVRVTPA